MQEGQPVLLGTLSVDTSGDAVILAMSAGGELRAVGCRQWRVAKWTVVSGQWSVVNSQ